MIYPVKHFLATLLLGPIIPTLYDVKSMAEPEMPTIKQAIKGLIETYPLFLIFGFIFALPVFILYYLSYRLFIKTTLKPIVIKLILNAEAITGLIITLKVIDGEYVPTAAISYSIAVVISSLLFKLRPLQNTGVSNRKQHSSQ